MSARGTLPEPARVVEHDRGRVELYARADVVATIASGQIVLGDSRALTELAESVRRRTGRVRVFHDWHAVESYSSEARVHLTKWTLDAPRGSIAECHVLVRSRLVAMGVSTAALALRFADIPLFSYTLRAPFEARLTEALSRAETTT